MNEERMTIGGEHRFVKSISEKAPSLFKDLVKVEELIIRCSYHTEHDNFLIFNYSGNTYRVFKDEHLLNLEENYIQEIQITIMAREFGKPDSYMYTVNLFSLKELEKFSIKLDFMSIHER